MVPKLKYSYEKIFNEFAKMEKSATDFISMNKNKDQVRKKRVQMLEIKLQNFCDEIKNFNPNSINNQFDELLVDFSPSIKKSSNYLENCEKNINIKEGGINLNTESKEVNKKRNNVLRHI
jgi:hypothetical protein